MADNYLERHYEEYEKRKAAWLKKTKHTPKPQKQHNYDHNQDT